MNSEQNNSTENEWELKLADYSMGVMDAEAAAEFERGLNECRVHVTTADHYAQTIGMIGLTVAPAEPPEGHKARLLSRLDATPQERPSVTSRTGPLPILGTTPPQGMPVVSQLPDSTRPHTQPLPINVTNITEYKSRRGLAGAIPIVASIAAALLILVSVWGWFSTRNEINALQTQLDHLQNELVQAKSGEQDAKQQVQDLQAKLNIPPRYVAFAVSGQAPQPGSSGVAFVDPKTEDFQLVAQGLQPLSPSQVYEMWWVPKDNSPPVQAGTFRTDASGTARHTPPKPPAPLSNYAAIAVTQEKAPGVSTAQGPLVLLGKYEMP